MNYFIFNLADKSREQAASFLRAKMWPLLWGERHCDALAPGDRVLIHVAKPQREFIGRAELATAFSDWTALGAEASLEGPSGGVSLVDVEEWTHPVPLDVAVHRIDPTASNPKVQGNAEGFQSGIVLIDAEEYAAVVALSRESRQT